MLCHIMFNLESRPCPWEIRAFKGHPEVNMSNGSGIPDPRFETTQIEITRSDRTLKARSAG